VLSVEVGGLDELFRLLVVVPSSTTPPRREMKVRKTHGDEELGSVGVTSSVGHGQKVGAVVALDEVLILELLSVDGLSSGSLLMMSVMGVP
jgi:hypothetical protein